VEEYETKHVRRDMRKGNERNVSSKYIGTKEGTWKLILSRYCRKRR
jgi:hypothetical protein